MSTKRKRAVLSIKDKQIIISRLEMRERNKFSSRIWHQQAAENELPTSLQMSDEAILATVVGDSTESESVCSDEKDVSKNACRGWNHRTILTLCS